MDQEKEALRAEVAALQLKLHQLHATDVSTLRRSYATISQHIEALKAEASRLEELVHQLEPNIYTPDFVAEELGKAAAVGSASWVLYKLVKTITPLPAKAASWLRGSLFAVTAFVISWRFASSSIGRFTSAFWDHRRRKKAFLKEMEELQQRIDILQALTRSLPGAVSQTHLPGLAVAASSPAAAGQPAAGGQFVVVDLPRVESGGFMLASPMAGSPPLPVGAAAAGAAQLQPLGTSVVGLRPGEAEASSSGQPSQLAAAAGLQESQQQQQQQQAAAAASSSTSSSSAALPMRSAFHLPDAVMRSGWGGVAQQHLGLRPPATAATRQVSASSDNADEGVLIEQPGLGGGGASDLDGVSSSNNGRPGGTRVSPASSGASDDAVLLERD